MNGGIEMVRVNNCFICKNLYYKLKIDPEKETIESKKACKVSKYNIGNLVTFPFIKDQSCCEPKDE